MANEVKLVPRGPFEGLIGELARASSGELAGAGSGELAGASSDELAGASSDELRIEPVPLRSVINLRGRPSEALAAAIEAAFGVALPFEPNRWNGGRDRAAVWLGPDEWLLLAPAGESAALEQAVRNARPGDPWLSVTDVSHHHAALRLSGPRSRELLAGGCALDLRSPAFGPGACAQTTLARAQVWLRGLHGDTGIEVGMRNSFAAYLARWLARARAHS